MRTSLPTFCVTFTPFSRHNSRVRKCNCVSTQEWGLDDVAQMFDRFDMSKAEDVRDCTLLAIALQTGHRVSALTELCWQHVGIHCNIK